MYDASCESFPAGCGPAREPSPVCLPSAISLLLLPPRVLAATAYSAADVIKQTLDGRYDDCPVCHGCHGKGEPCCGIPEQSCPDPCVCRIVWEGCPGDSFQYRLQITNTSTHQREFTLTPLPFGCTEDTVTVAPDKKTLAQDESFQAVVGFTIPDQLAGGRYLARIKLTGAYEQIILVCLTVRPRQACCCHIEQGDIPKRIKAHHWYHHFQCIEDCAKPAAGAG
ncbi:COG1470 family protein [Marinobacter sp. SS21]|uniref:COG1470 family protein n=1 Tax=Marinobacter sp. SS21 TaxID=2979460 RepID=UPI00232E3063|nr:hypothetical protein [Marinobacter sp. SS21]MDC0664125.1 hypothetical protein [Marinobacter sp. SS21]